MMYLDRRLTAPSFRKMNVMLHEFKLSEAKIDVLLGIERGRTANAGNDKVVQDLDVAQTLAETDNSPEVSPLPLPEHIIQIIIDIVRLEKEEALAAHAAEDALFTHKAVEHANRYDGDLKNLSLVSRLWTQPARHALGRRLVLIMDAKRLRSIVRATENPLYGAWTQHVQIIEQPYAPACGMDYVQDIWSLARLVVSRLENVKTFTLNSRVLKASSSGLRPVLSSLKNLEELKLSNTGPLMTRTATDVGDDFVLPFQLPSLRRMTFQRCMPVLEEPAEHSGASSIRVADDISTQLRAMKPLLFTPLECCFHGHFISFKLDEAKAQWAIDDLSVSNSSSHCGEGCLYEDTSNVCAKVRSLSLSADAKNTIPTCLLKVLRNFTHLKILHLSLARLPAQDSDIFDAMSNALEEIYIKIESEPTLEEYATLDGSLLSFCDARSSTLRRVSMFSRGALGSDSQLELFPSTRAFCSKHHVELTVTVRP